MRNYYVPSAFLAPDAQSGEVEQPVAGTVQGVQALRWNIVRGGETVGTASATFDKGSLVLTERRSAKVGAAPWSLKLRPAGVEWTKASAGPAGKAMIEQSALSSHANVAVDAGANARLAYNALDPQFRGPSIAITSSEPVLELRISVPSETPTDSIVLTDQVNLLARHHITSVVIWRNTQLAGRFDSSQCFALRDSTDDLLIYDVQKDCLA
jgi:hypothetical protein